MKAGIASTKPPSIASPPFHILYISDKLSAKSSFQFTITNNALAPMIPGINIT